MSTAPLLAVIPCLNEEAHLPGLLAQLGDDPALTGGRIVVVDGGSSDRSVEIVRAKAAADPRFVLLHNPKRIQSVAVNLAVKLYGADAPFFVRIDAHAHYPADFLTRLIDAQRDTGADSVTVSMRAIGKAGACFQTAAATAQNSVLGAGGSAHRKGGERRWVDHGHHALFNTQRFLSVGGYDERFTHNEDAELDARLAQAGARILLAADILIDYVPRASALKLARQYFSYGRGRARTMLKHKQRLKPRQAAPLAVAPAVALLALAPFALIAAAPALAWLVLTLSFGVMLGVRQRSVCAACSGFAAAVMHVAWSAGFWRQVLAGGETAPFPAEGAPQSS